MFRNISIKTKLILALSAILILAFLAIGILNYNASRKSLWRNIKEEALPGIGNEIYNEIEKDLMMPLQVAATMANDTFLRDWVLNGEKDIEKVTKYLWGIREKNDFSSTFLISTETKKYYHYNGILKTISKENDHDDWYFRFVNSGSNYDLVVDTDQAKEGALTVFINYRLNDYEGNLIGVTGVGLNMNKLGRRLHKYQERYDKSIYLVNKKGVVQIHSKKELVAEENLYNREGMKGITDDLLSKSETHVIKEYKKDGKKTIVLSRYIPEFDWFLIVEHTAGQAMEKIQNRFLRNMAIGLIVTILVIVIYVLLINHYQGRLEEMANKDVLTDLSNRRHFLDQAEEKLSRTLSTGRPISLLMIDIDDFKKVNDTYGHSAGDKLLEGTAELLSQGLREEDLIGRMGGDEFAVALPATPEEEAREVAERLRKMVESSDSTLGPNSYSPTISAGVATAGPDEFGDDLEKLLKEADKALYRAKEDGRNRVRCQGEVSTEDF